VCEPFCDVNHKEPPAKVNALSRKATTPTRYRERLNTALSLRAGWYASTYAGSPVKANAAHVPRRSQGMQHGFLQRSSRASKSSTFCLPGNAFKEAVAQGSTAQMSICENKSFAFYGGKSSKRKPYTGRPIMDG